MNSTNIGVDLVQNLLANNYNWDEDESIYDLIQLFEYIVDPRIARVVFSELLSNGCDVYDIINNTYCQHLLCAIAESGSIEVMQYMLGVISKKFSKEQIANMVINKDMRIDDITTTTSFFENNPRIGYVHFESSLRNKNIKIDSEFSKTVMKRDTDTAKLLAHDIVAKKN